MKHTLLTLTLAAQFAAVGALAQTTPTTSGTSMGTGGHGATQVFGHDWSSSLVSAVFEEDGDEYELRSESELTERWEDLSQEDRDMIRRDCMMHEQQASMTDSATGATGTTATGTAGTTGTAGSVGAGTGTAATTGTQTAPSTDGSESAMNVSAEQMDEICEVIQDL